MIDIGFVCLEVVFFEGIIKYLEGVVVIVLIVFGGIYIILCCYGVCLVGVVLEVERFDFIVYFCKGSSGRVVC